MTQGVGGLYDYPVNVFLTQQTQGSQAELYATAAADKHGDNINDLVRKLLPGYDMPPGFDDYSGDEPTSSKKIIDPKQSGPPSSGEDDALNFAPALFEFLWKFWKFLE